MPTHIQSLLGLLRNYEDGRSFEAWDPYLAVGTVVMPTPKLAFIMGVHGELHRRHLVDVRRALSDIGVRIAYIWRAPGHRMPYATQVQSGPLKGAWEMKIPPRAVSPQEPLKCPRCGHDTSSTPTPPL